MINGWLALDRMAALRGDGLDPAFRTLLDGRDQARQSFGNLVDLTRLRDDPIRQSGPISTPQIDGTLPENVVRFPGRAT